MIVPWMQMRGGDVWLLSFPTGNLSRSFAALGSVSSNFWKDCEKPVAMIVT